MSSNAFQLFPNPSTSPSRISPNALPGITPEATETAKNVLQDDFEKHHVFFNDKGFHNHIAHHVLAVWALGANGAVIQATYDHDKGYQRPAYKSPEAITRQNFNEHLGDENYYNAYLNYFVEALKQKDASAVLEEHVFSSAANFASKNKSGEHPEMVTRFLDALLHPMIHTGYGIEFKIPGLIAEGLAQTAVHKVRTTNIIPPSSFIADPVPSVGKLASRLHSVVLGSQKPSATHAFTILARIFKDEAMKPGADEDNMFTDAVANLGDSILRHVNEWADFDPSDAQLIERKVEELQWANVLIYALPGYSYREEKNFNADFFTMHLVTSSLFLPSLVAVLSPSSQHTLLRSYFAVSLIWWIARGKPALDIGAFFDGTTTQPTLEGTPATSKGPKISLAPSSSVSELNPNPWFSILQQAIDHPDDHLCKCQRALAHYSALYGSRAAGQSDFSETELPGADRLDGTLFVRAAGLTAQRLGRERDDQPLTYWDRTGFVGAK